MTASGAQRAGTELAYAEYTAGVYAVVQTSPTNIPAMSLAIPAGSGPYWLEFWVLAQVASGGSWTTGQINARVQLVDEGGVVLATANARPAITAASQSFYQTLTVKRRMAAPAVNKTITAQAWADNLTNLSFSLWNGPGNTTTNGALGPMYLAAVAR